MQVIIIAVQADSNGRFENCVGLQINVQGHISTRDNDTRLLKTLEYSFLVYPHWSKLVHDRKKKLLSGQLFPSSFVTDFWALLRLETALIQSKNGAWNVWIEWKKDPKLWKRSRLFDANHWTLWPFSCRYLYCAR